MSRNSLALTKAATAPTRPDAIFEASQFGPWAPIRPFPIDQGPEPRFSQYLPGFNLPQTPGNGKLAPFDLLKQASMICTPLRRALEIRKEELSTQPWDIRIKEQYARQIRPEDIDEQRRALLTFFSRPNPYEKESFSDWIREAEENVAVLDAFAVYPRKTLGANGGVLASGLASLDIIDGSTVKPIINVRGGTPIPPAVAYQQYLYGAPRIDFMGPDVEEDDPDNPVVMKLNAQQLYYRRFNRIPGQIYGLSNVETALVFIKLWIGRVRYHQNYFDDSSVPAGFMTMPPDYKQQQIDTFERDLNRILSADSSWRWRIKGIPAGAKFDQLKPPQYAMDFDDWIITQLASCMDVTAEELGVTPRHGLGGKGWAEAAGQRQIRLALQPRLTFYQEFFQYVIEVIFGIHELEFAFLDPDQTDKLEKAQADNLYVSNGTRARNEVREDNGWDKSDDPMADKLTVTTSQGLVTLDDAETISAANAEKANQPPPSHLLPGQPQTPPANVQLQQTNKDVTAATGLQPYDLDGEGKLSKAAVGYASQSTDAYQCQNCMHWQGNGVCALVDGSIDPQGWCERYEENTLKAAMAELGRWERFAAKPWARQRVFVCKSVSADLATSIQSSLDQPPNDIPTAIWRTAVFTQARELLRERRN